MTSATNLTCAVLGAALVALSASSAIADGYAYRHGAVAHVVTVSCYRGPWNEVIWDRPNPVFIDSLVRAGYTYPEAHAIAERVCRDPSGVGQSGNLRATMQGILRSTPPGS